MHASQKRPTLKPLGFCVVATTPCACACTQSPHIHHTSTTIWLPAQPHLLVPRRQLSTNNTLRPAHHVCNARTPIQRWQPACSALLVMIPSRTSHSYKGLLRLLHRTARVSKPLLRRTYCHHWCQLQPTCGKDSVQCKQLQITYSTVPCHIRRATPARVPRTRSCLYVCARVQRVLPLHHTDPTMRG
jgi:hypothetical protein